ncbi:MAG: topology modulation protein, partial [Planctomycetota bacterium]
RAKLAVIVAEERWIIDGNYSRHFDLRLPRADTVIWLDYPPRLYCWRMFKRNLTARFRERPDITEGCEERFDPEFFRYVWRFHKDRRPELVEVTGKLPAATQLHHFRRPAETRRWLAEVGTAPEDAIRR